MTRVVATAPGKLVLLGEYAVLEGAPALVLAVNRRARVTLVPTTGEFWEIVSPTLGLDAAFRFSEHGLAWRAPPPAELAWIANVFGQLSFASKLAPCRIDLDSDAFHLDLAGERVKLGLGSSAALTVALIGALRGCAELPAPALDECVRAHRAIQQGRGSGIDVAASLAGGLSRFRLEPGRTPRRDALAVPDSLHWCCVFSGKPASTGAMLAAVRAWRERDGTGYARHMNELATISSRGVDAVVQHDAAAFLSNFQDYAHALARFGAACGADIASRAHRELGAVAASCGTVYKSCGAGGGDAGVTFAVDDTRVREFAGRARQAGFPVIGMEADPKGLDVVKTV